MVPLIEKVDHFGALHIIVEDWNLEDDHIAYCRSHEDLTDAERELLDLLAEATDAERCSALAFADGYADLAEGFEGERCQG